MLRERYKELEEKEIALYHSCEETVKKVQEGDGEALGIITDVASESSTQAMAAQTVQRFGRIDTLVNNAALLLHYVASKGVVFAFTRALARELVDTGIITNLKKCHLLVEKVDVNLSLLN